MDIKTTIILAFAVLSKQIIYNPYNSSNSYAPFPSYLNYSAVGWQQVSYTTNITAGSF